MSTSIPQPLEIEASDQVATILQKRVGSRAEVFLRSGLKWSGKIEFVGGSVLHMTQLTGQEFYDAVIDLNEVAGVVTRVR